MKKAQAVFDRKEILPTAGERCELFALAISAFTSAGYRSIGLDHFALPDDELARARRDRTLKRNFMGYSTRAGFDLIGLGVSAIGEIGTNYAQNAKALPEYCDAMRNGRFATVRGLTLDHDDLLRRAVIMAIMCQGEVNYARIEAAHAIDFHSRFAHELAQLQALEAQGLLALGRHGFKLPPSGWYVVRAVAMVFDKYLHAERDRTRYSRVV